MSGSQKCIKTRIVKMSREKGSLIKFKFFNEVKIREVYMRKLVNYSNGKSKAIASYTSRANKLQAPEISKTDKPSESTILLENQNNSRERDEGVNKSVILPSIKNNNRYYKAQIHASNEGKQEGKLSIKESYQSGKINKIDKIK